MPTQRISPKGSHLRKGRFSETGRIYLITTVTHQRTPLFHDLQLGRAVVHALMGTQPGAETLCYVLMPDHLHWLMQLDDESELSNVVQSIKSVSAHRINQALRRTGRIWQANFHDHALRKDEDVISVARYVVANPLRAKLVKSLSDYPLWDAKWL